MPGVIALLPRRKLKKKVTDISRDAERLTRNQRLLCNIVLSDCTEEYRQLLEQAVDHESYIEGNH